MSHLSLYDRFVLIVRAKDQKKALEIAGDNPLLKEIVTYLSCYYLLYEEK